MSGAARRRGGRGRATAGDENIPDAPRRGRGGHRPPAGGFDGPAPRGSGSGGGSRPRRGSNAPPVDATRPSVTGSPQGAQPESRQDSVSGQQVQAGSTPARDPA